MGTRRARQPPVRRRRQSVGGRKPPCPPAHRQGVDTGTSRTVTLAHRAGTRLTPLPWPFPAPALLPVHAHVTAGSAQISFPDRRSPAGNKIKDHIQPPSRIPC
ncbi:hypothetical protein SEVIR_5G141401v4 [Setaria viridis]